MDFRTNRPAGFVAKGDRYLPHVSEDLERVIAKTQQSYEHDTLRLPYLEREELASVLVEFAEDLHNDIGIWASLELNNREFFGAPLPLVGERQQHLEEEPINEFRARYLLWVLFSVLKPGLVLSPTHRDLRLLAAVVSGFLRKRFAIIPRGSGVKKFLSQPNTYGWDVKTKLVWLGTHSYLFRDAFRNYVEDNGGKAEIPVVDDFLCQVTTDWSGLGVIDILASALEISGEQQSELRSWYERHQAYYRVLTAADRGLEVVNLISGKPYRITMSPDNNPFQAGMIVFGGLVPWNREWYWSGAQHTLGSLSEEALQQITETFRRKLFEVTYRYCEDLAEKAREVNKTQHREFVQRYGSDLVIYPDGLSMVAEFEKHIRQQWESKPKEIIEKVIEHSGLKGPQPDTPFPDELLNAKSGVGVYYDPEQGMEMMTGFKQIVSGLRKKGDDLTEDEADAIRSFIMTDSVGPGFVKRAVEEYGGRESINAAFHIHHDDGVSLDYLLRRHKGAYYRKRYPRIAIV